MNRIRRVDQPARLAGRLFDDILVPLAEARRSSGAAPFLSPWRDPGCTTCFVSPESPAIDASDLAFPGGSPNRLVDKLVCRWISEGNTDLVALGPHLKKISAALKEQPKDGDGSVSIFCYTMF